MRKALAAFGVGDFDIDELNALAPSLLTKPGLRRAREHFGIIGFDPHAPNHADWFHDRRGEPEHPQIELHPLRPGELWRVDGSGESYDE